METILSLQSSLLLLQYSLKLRQFSTWDFLERFEKDLNELEELQSILVPMETMFSFVVVLIEVGAMFSMKFFDRIEQDYKLEETASIHPCSKGNNIVPFVVVLTKLWLLSAWDFLKRIE
jgi:hypothetical protein